MFLAQYNENSDKLYELWASGQEDSEDYKILLNKSFELWAGLNPEQKQNLNFPFHHE
jgi:hypothetical protein